MKKIFILLLGFIIYSGLLYCQGTWTQKADYPGGSYSYFGICFIIDDKAYVGGLTNECFYEYNPEFDEWTQKAQLPIANDLCAFSINNFGYIIKTNTNEVWQYNQSTDTWLQKGNFPGTEKYNIPIAFSFEGKGYYGLGKDVDSENLSDLWEYNPIDDSWIQLTDMPIGRSSATVFLIGDKAYIGSGQTDLSTYSNDFWMYDIENDTWSQIADFAGSGRERSVSFSINGLGFVGTGLSGGIYMDDFWTYNPTTNTWEQLDDFAGPARQGGVGFAINNKGYISCGYNGNLSVTVYPDLWEYNQEQTSISTNSNPKLFEIEYSTSNKEIEVFSNEQNINVVIINTYGQTMFRSTTTKTINVGSFSSGIYFIKLNSGKEYKLFKLFIN